MEKKLYVGGIPYTTSEEELQAEFEKAGKVESAAIIQDRETQRSRGFGFVEMADEAGAKAAIEMWDGKEMGGRTIVVNEARPLEKRD